MFEQLLSPGSWGSPLGLGVFLVCFGIFVFLTSKADWYDRDKKKEREKDKH